MSEFQFSLLTIGIVVVAGVFLYGQWQQWRYRRSFGAPTQERQVAEPQRMSPAAIIVEEPDGVLAPAPAISDAADEVCGLLNDATDYIANFLLKTPATVDVLDTLWQRRFDFGKSVNACGLNAGSDRWERLIPDSPQTYRAFRIGLQLVDRAGSVSEMRLAGFHDLLNDIAAQLQVEVRLPSVQEALQRAQELDRFCADVDKMIGINLLTSGDRKLFGTEVASAAEQSGMKLQADGTFHLVNAQGATVYSLSAADETPFQHHTLNQLRVDSLTLLLDIPRVDEPVRRFDEMVALARELAKTLRTTMTDDQRVALSDGAIAQIRAQVAATEDLMLVGHITPGSAQALRLFA
ncbi:MAG TPA: cell division protein ZipA C-terminal FtsZ-binding domain-containing protein [Sideroxyarcus sp.]|nr:cell division protein ZipA C-terminal FtsZ-binding domain-containing protein [Sideroxyarcus sp.]